MMATEGSTQGGGLPDQENCASGIFKSLGHLARGVAAGPGPLKIVAAQPAGHIDHFADEIESRHAPRFHCFR